MIVQLIFVGNFIWLFSLIIDNQNFYATFGFERADVSESDSAESFRPVWD